MVAVEVPEHHQCKHQRDERIHDRGVCHQLVNSDGPSRLPPRNGAKPETAAPDEIQNPDGGGSQRSGTTSNAAGAWLPDDETREQTEKYRRDACDSSVGLLIR